MLMAVTDQNFADSKAEQSAFMCNNFVKMEN